MNHTGFFLFLDALVDFLAVNGDLLGGIDADPDLIAFDAKHGDLNIVTDVEGFSNASRQYQPDQACGCWWRVSNSYYGLTAGASYDLSRASRFTPYLKAGTGVYYTRQSTTPANGQVLVSQLPLLNYRSAFSLGVNGGLGVKVRIGSHEFFVEEMLHAFDVRHLEKGVYPLSFGLRF